MYWTSAKTGTGINELFEGVCLAYSTKIRESTKKADKFEFDNPNSDNRKKKGC
jgi:hypothetical protein